MPDSTPPPPALAIRVASRSDVGMRRATNQDSLAVSPSPTDSVIAGDAFLLVADGMGAHAAGELASQIAADAIPLTYLKSGAEATASALRRAIREANEAIHAKGDSSPEFNGMGTTCSCLVVTNGAALIGHVGDSRVYRLRAGVFEQLTFDHSLVWEMAAASNVSADKVPSCIPKNVITRSLGPHESVNIDLEGPHGLEAGDVFLLCSDGLTGVVDDPLAGGVLSAMDPQEAATTLVDLANLRGGPDNISVVVARVEDASPKSGAGQPTSTKSSAPGSRLAVGVAAICVMACGWFLMQGHVAGMLASAIGLGAAIAYSIAVKPIARSATSPPRPLGGPYGNGPYRRTECGDLASAAGDLRDLVRELADLDSEEDTVRPDGGAVVNAASGPLPGGLLVEWDTYKPDQEKADAAFEKGDNAAAMDDYASIIRRVMQSIRDDDGTHRYKANSGIIG